MPLSHFYPPEVRIVSNMTRTLTERYDFELLLYPAHFQKYLSLSLLLCHLLRH